MKKLSYLFAVVALVASLASCNKKEDVGSDFFKITVSNIEATTADVAIVPADTTTYYSVSMYYATDFVKYGADSLAAEYVAQLAEVAKSYGVETLIQYGYISQGEIAGPVENLIPNTEFAIVAFDLVVSKNDVKLGKEISYKTFKTKDIEIKSEVDLGVLSGGGFEDYRSEDGSYIAYATDNLHYDVTLNIYDEDFNGNYTMADLDAEYSYIWTSEMNSETALALIQAELKNVPGNGNNATLSGWVVASNNIKYKFSFTYPTVEADGAPVKKAAKAAKLEPAKLHVIRK